jgi:hypothetical protein
MSVNEPRPVNKPLEIWTSDWITYQVLDKQGAPGTKEEMWHVAVRTIDGEMSLSEDTWPEVVESSCKLVWSEQDGDLPEQYRFDTEESEDSVE